MGEGPYYRNSVEQDADNPTDLNDFEKKCQDPNWIADNYGKIFIFVDDALVCAGNNLSRLLKAAEKEHSVDNMYIVTISDEPSYEVRPSADIWGKNEPS